MRVGPGHVVGVERARRSDVLVELAGHDGHLGGDRRDLRVPAGLGVARLALVVVERGRELAERVGRLVREPAGQVVRVVEAAEQDRLAGAGGTDRVDQRLHADRP